MNFISRMPLTGERIPSISAILLDIEGTTTSISFVHDVLFPYAKENVGKYLHDHQGKLTDLIDRVKVIANTPDADLPSVINTLVSWMNQDKKITELKELQGMMWEEGYKIGAFKGHVYSDAYEQMKSWKGSGMPLYIYSSGSVQAQKLLYGYSEFGDITDLFSCHFDTKIGSKKEVASYVAISEKINCLASSILFLSDSIDELKAAEQAGMQVYLVCRESNLTGTDSYPVITNFNEIEIKEEA